MADAQRSMEARVGRDKQRYGPSGERLVAGVVGLSLDKNYVLLISSTRRSNWVLPKGGWETDEATEQDAAAREAWEEAGITIKITRDLGKIDDRRKPNEMTPEAPNATYRFFEATVSKLEDEWPEKHKRGRQWMTYSQASQALKNRPELLEALNRCSLLNTFSTGWRSCLRDVWPTVSCEPAVFLMPGARLCCVNLSACSGWGRPEDATTAEQRQLKGRPRTRPHGKAWQYSTKAGRARLHSLYGAAGCAAATRNSPRGNAQRLHPARPEEMRRSGRVGGDCASPTHFAEKGAVGLACSRDPWRYEHCPLHGSHLHNHPPHTPGRPLPITTLRPVLSLPHQPPPPSSYSRPTMSFAPQQQTLTPPHSRKSSTSEMEGRRTKSSSLSLDLTQLPPLITPSPPSNTLLITNLQDPAIFTATTLAHLRAMMDQATPAGIYAFSPLRTLRRIVVTFWDVESATAVRALLDGEVILGDRVRVYFGEPTPLRALDDKERHLQAPKLDKQFFISPPPSPPAGWEVRLEDAPNKEVHPSDLTTALQRLNASTQPDGRDVVMEDADVRTPVSAREGQRSRSGTIVYHPEDHGNSPNLPAIAVEDTTASPGDMSPVADLEDAEGGGKILAHTSRPPVELMS
ncbi:hypothetical protein FH972_025721 [Carpinus fangiana]|uniref:Nudix hydrolase domain-containing protein n=1 Tax=Carpinus fangiana TaxID=176857 RepID=A0A5N6L1X8_9ROSI|nr:hypothetical protein FH972_025721 [Carpinus fangiana]